MKYDLKNNLRHSAVLLAIAGLIMLIVSLQLKNVLTQLEQPGYWGDYILNLFGGVRIYDFSDKNLNFDVPKEYIFVTLIIGLVGYRYVSSHYSRNSAVVFGSRKKWIAGKIMSNSVIIILVYGMGILITGIVSGFSLGFNESFDKKAYRITNVPDGASEMILAMVCCILMALAISMVQTMIAMFTDYFVGFIVAMGIYIVSMLDCSPLFAGNGIMLLRYSCFTAKGSDAIVYLISALGLIVVSGVIILAGIKRKDII